MGYESDNPARRLNILFFSVLFVRSLSNSLYPKFHRVFRGTGLFKLFFGYVEYRRYLYKLAGVHINEPLLLIEIELSSFCVGFLAIPHTINRVQVTTPARRWTEDGTKYLSGSFLHMDPLERSHLKMRFCQCRRGTHTCGCACTSCLAPLSAVGLPFAGL